VIFQGQRVKGQGYSVT